MQELMRQSELFLSQTMLAIRDSQAEGSISNAEATEARNEVTKVFKLSLMGLTGAAIVDAYSTMAKQDLFATRF